MLEHAISCLKDSPIIDKDGYPYVVCPLLDGIPFISPSILHEMIEKLDSLLEQDCDLILAPEAMSLPYVSPLSMKRNIPFSVVRKRSYGLPGEIPIMEVTGYSKTAMYINGLRPGLKVAILDDVVSTGGTLKALVEAVRNAGSTITEIVVVVDKSDNLNAVSKAVGVPIKAAIKMTVTDGKIDVH